MPKLEPRNHGPLATLENASIASGHHTCKCKHGDQLIGSTTIKSDHNHVSKTKIVLDDVYDSCINELQKKMGFALETPPGATNDPKAGC